MRNDSIRLKGKKKASTSQYQSFEHNGREICDQQRLDVSRKAGPISKTIGIAFCCKIGHIWSFFK